MQEEQKALFEACMKQAEFFAGRWDGRRTDEWKTTAAVWAVIVYGRVSIKNPNLLPCWEMIAFIVLYAIFWLKPVWEANDRDKTAMRFYQNRAEEVMRSETAAVPKRPIPKLRKPYDLV